MPEEVDVALVQQLVTLNPEEVIVPLRIRREEVSKLRAVKLTDQEVIKVQDFQDYLMDTGFLAENTFASLFVYMFNLTYTLHKTIYDAEKKKEVQNS